MKKVLLGLGALLMMCMITSCTSDFDKVKGLTKELKETSDDWDKEKWIQVMNDFYEAGIHFYQSEPSAEEFDKYEELSDDFYGAVEESGSYREVFKHIKDKEFNEDILEKFEDAREKCKKRLGKKDPWDEEVNEKDAGK